MRLTFSLLALVGLLATATMATADSLKGREDIRQQTGAFMEKVTESEISAAYKGLRPFLGVDSAPYDESANDAVSYFHKVTEKVGEPIGNSHVKTDIIANDFIRESWLQKFKAAAIAWRFTFYQPGDNGWKLVGVSYSTDMENLYHTLE